MRAFCSALGDSCGGAPGVSGRAVAHFQLGEDALQLLVGNLLLQARNFGLGIQFAQACR